MVESQTALESMAMANEEVRICKKAAEFLHKGVPYGQSTMIDQVLGTAELVVKYSNLPEDEKWIVVCAALLHKSQEKKRLGMDWIFPQQPLSDADIEIMAGPQVSKIVHILAQEPEDKNKSKIDQWHEKATWALNLSENAKSDEDKMIALAVQEIMMAEKLQNFYTSRDNPNPKKHTIWHKQYYMTRMILMNALKWVNRSLYLKALKVQKLGIEKLEKKGCSDRELYLWEVMQADYRARKRCA